jgi:hypothetical protein
MKKAAGHDMSVDCSTNRRQKVTTRLLTWSSGQLRKGDPQNWETERLDKISTEKKKCVKN